MAGLREKPPLDGLTVKTKRQARDDFLPSRQIELAHYAGDA